MAKGPPPVAVSTLNKRIDLAQSSRQAGMVRLKEGVEKKPSFYFSII